MPMARTMHQPFRASKIANAPPKVHPATANHPRDAGMTLKYVSSEMKIPKAMAAMPV